MNLILISKKEAEFLRKNGRSDDVHVSSKNHKSGSKRYYLTTAPKSMKLLENYRQTVISTNGGE